jgi:hypothetical protein
MLVTRTSKPIGLACEWRRRLRPVISSARNNPAGE